MRWDILEISIKDGKIYSYIRDKWLVCTPEEDSEENKNNGE